MSEKAPQLTIHIYWEDTDAGGVVYHANYVKFMERARSEFVKSLGVNQEKLRQNHLGMVVAKLEVAYKSPSMLDDTLTVTTHLTRLKHLSMEFRQVITRGETLITDGTIRIGLVDLRTGRPVKFPEEIYNAFLPYLEN